MTFPARRCPRCSAELAAKALGPRPVLGCRACGGLWLDHATFADLKGETRHRSPPVSPENPPGPQRPPPGAAMYLRCPLCDELMQRKNFAQRSGIIVDVCRRDGLWFDADELSAVLRYHTTSASNPPPQGLPIPPARQENRHREEDPAVLAEAELIDDCLWEAIYAVYELASDLFD